MARVTDRARALLILSADCSSQPLYRSSCRGKFWCPVTSVKCGRATSAGQCGSCSVMGLPIRGSRCTLAAGTAGLPGRWGQPGGHPGKGRNLRASRAGRGHRRSETCLPGCCSWVYQGNVPQEQKLQFAPFRMLAKSISVHAWRKKITKQHLSIISELDCSDCTGVRRQAIPHIAVLQPA